MTGVDRRHAIRLLGTGLASASPLLRAAEALAIPGPPPSPASAPSRAVVALARREGLLSGGRAIDAAKLADALGAAVARAAGESNPVDACRKLFSSRDVVGIKVNGMGGKGLSSRPEVAFQLAEWMVAAGVPASRIVVFERTERELKAAGYRLNEGSGVHVVGVDGDYEEKVREWGPAASRFARILVEEMTALVNLPVLKDHGFAGISLGMKNWYGVVHNPNKLHADLCRPFIPHLAGFPLLRDKLRLTVVDGTLAQCHAGPGYNPAWTWPFQGYLATTDAVAADAVGWRIVEERRKELGLPSLAADGRAPLHVVTAGRLGIGVSDRERIEVARV